MKYHGDPKAVNKEEGVEEVAVRSISDERNKHNCFYATPEWSNNGGDEAMSYSLTLGPGSFADIIVSNENGSLYRVAINKRFPPFGYHGIQTKDLETAMRLVNEWWKICFLTIATTYDYNSQPDVDLSERKRWYTSV